MEVNRIVLILSYVLLVFSVDRQNFKTCEQSGFCKRQRHPTTKHEYEIEAASVKSNGTAITAYLVSKINTLRLTLVSLEDSTLRLVIDETEKALRPRFQPLYALKDAEHLRYSKFKDIEIGAESTSLSLEDREKVILYYKPFRIDIFHKDEMIMSVNSGSFLFFEHFRLKDDGNEEEAKEGFWSESFKSHHDSKPYGSSSVGLDFSFIGYKFVFGLPEHSDSFALRSTNDSRGLDPYRLYNLDVFEYEIGNQMALYGSVPFITAHNKERTLAVLWLNAAETWVDIASSTADKGVLASIVDKFKTSADVPQIDAHFMSESGLIDAFIMLGPSPKDIFRQNSALTGVYPLPPLFSLGYHQCRWNYNDEEDVKKVHDGFEEHDIPLDTIWLDIEHTDGKKYFTWDPKKFPTPKDMISGLTAKGRKMVTIIDPHIKKDDGFRIYKEAKDLGYFVKDKNGNDFEGHCWPGTSLYLDFVNPVVRDYWAGNFAFDKYDGSTEDVFVWNDMNEPSVFSGPEITMPKDARHFGDWEHRDIHNMYGLLHHSSTYKGLMARSDNKIRPFILTRSFFIGSQRTTAVWTGDNTADWSHLRATVPMLLSLSISGIPHVGADVGGFFKNPDDELLVRWYQAGAFQPFFRSHAHIDCKRREPWLFPDNVKNAIRKAIRLRYAFLPYWYTLFYEHSLTGAPPMRPLWVEFPTDEDSFDEEREWLVGRGLLVRPVLDPGKTSISLYLPGRRNVMWYEWHTHKPRPAPGAIYMDSPLDFIPLMQLGGTIIPTRERVRRSSALSRQDPITLYVAASFVSEQANGTLYLDDGESFDYRNGQYSYWGFTYKKVNPQLYTLQSHNLAKGGKLETDVYIERIVIRGVRYFPRNVHMYLDDWNPEDLEFDFDRDTQHMVIKNPAAPVNQEFQIDIHC